MATKLANKHFRLRVHYKRPYTTAYSIWTQWISLLQVCQHYLAQKTFFIIRITPKIAQKNSKVYSTTAVAATRTFVAKIQRALTPPQQTWAMLEAGTEIEDEGDREKVNEYLDHVTKIVFDHIRASNFDLVINECYLDLAIGTAILVLNEGGDKDPLKFILYL